MSDSNKYPQTDYRLKNLNNALYIDGNDDVVVRTGFVGNIVISGNVNIPGDVTVNSSPEDPVHVHLTELGTFGNLTTYVPVRGNVTVDNFPTNVSITQMPGITGNVGVSGNVSITQMPAVAIASLPEVEIKNDTGNPIPVSANTAVNGPTNRIYVSMETDAVVADSNYYLNVARGLVPGHESMERSAFMPATPNTETSIWVEGGIYPHGTWTSPSVLYVASSSAADTAQTIFIEGLDSNYNYVTANVTTNGTTAVATTQTFIRIYTATITSASSNLANAGDIRFRIGSSSGTVVAHIGIGLGVTKLSQYTVPAGHTAYVMYGDVATFKNGAGNQSGVVKMMVRPYGGAFFAAFIAQISNGYYRNDFTVPLPVPARADIDVRITTDATGATVSANYQLLVIPN